MDKANAEKWMREAIVEAERAAALAEVPVGALLMNGEQIVSRAHNLVETRQDATCHAEMLVIKDAASRLGTWRLSELTLYVTLEPCPMCIGAIILSRIPTLCFGARDPRMGAVGSRFDLSDYPDFPHRIEVFSEVLQDECEALLKKFFRELR